MIADRGGRRYGARQEFSRTVDRAAARLRDVSTEQPRVGLILGSGLGGFADTLDAPSSVSFGDVPGFPRAGVDGHRGRVVFGRLDGLPCVVLEGRAHLYEGHTPGEVRLPARALARLGIETLIATSAAGGIDRTFEPGDLMIVSDHVNLIWRPFDRHARAYAPLPASRRRGQESCLADPVRIGASTIYDPRLRQLAEQVALDEGIRVVHGVYCAVLGPSYETPAEIRMLARLGAHAVGMSMVPEATAACAAGVPVLGISLITNRAAGLGAEHLSHDDVLARAGAAAPRFERLVRGVLARIFTEPRAGGR